jgi:molybdopterin synthase sulfur carrier subunit
MSVSVRIPTPLRKYTAGQDLIAVEGATVGAALTDLGQRHPDLRPRLYDDAGNLRRFINIFANNEDIRFLDGPDTALKAGDEISLVPAIAGGR